MRGSTGSYYVNYCTPRPFRCQDIALVLQLTTRSHVSIRGFNQELSKPAKTTTSSHILTRSIATLTNLMASSSSGFTGFTDATKREVVRVYGQRCWHCHFSPAEHAHVLPKVFDQERVCYQTCFCPPYHGLMHDSLAIYKVADA